MNVQPSRLFELQIADHNIMTCIVRYIAEDAEYVFFIQSTLAFSETNSICYVHLS